MCRHWWQKYGIFSISNSKHTMNTYRQNSILRWTYIKSFHCYNSSRSLNITNCNYLIYFEKPQWGIKMPQKIWSYFGMESTQINVTPCLSKNSLLTDSQFKWNSLRVDLYSFMAMRTGGTVIATERCLPACTCISKCIVLKKGIIVAWVHNESSTTLKMLIHINTWQEATFPLQILLKIKK